MAKITQSRRACERYSDEIEDQYVALAELPDLGSHFIAAGERKPAISKFGDLYHVTLDRAVGKARHLRGITTSRLESPQYDSAL